MIKNNNGSWIFISHSSSDIEKVRMIRNEFEKYGQNPLAFHLKCLSDETEAGKKELFDLIQREIEARDWFVYCESESAEKSAYVQMEREYVLKCQKQFIWLINLDQDEETIKKKIYEICCSLQVYVVYKHSAKEYAYPIIKELRKNDFSVWTPEESLVAGENYASTIEHEILKIAKLGFLLYIVTDDSSSKSVLFEIQSAKEKGARIITFVFNNAQIDKDIKPILGRDVYYIPCLPKEEDMYLLVNLIKEALKRRISGLVTIQADLYNAMNDLQEKLNYEGNYHEQEAILSGSTGATEDYLDIYTFPCCGKHVVVGDGPISRFRYDGCHKGK